MLRLAIEDEQNGDYARKTGDGDDGANDLETPPSERRPEALGDGLGRGRHLR